MIESVNIQQYSINEHQCPSVLNDIANYMLFRSSYTSDVSLFHGKSGVMLALYAYSKKYAKPVFREYADDLMQEIYKMVHEDLPIGIEQGLAGIGYTFSLLSNAEIIKCDLNDVLYTIDYAIMCRDPRRITETSIKKALHKLNHN